MRNLMILLLLLVAGAFLLASCDDVTDPDEGLRLLLQTPPLGPVIAVEARDARTGRQVPSGLTVTVGGPDAGRVIDVAGAPSTSFTSARGAVALALDASTAPTEADPIDLVLQVASPGYLTTSQPVRLVDGVNLAQTVFLVDLVSPPDGVTVASTAADADQQGAVTATVELEASDDDGGGVHVTIPAGTRLFDADGVPVTGALQVRAVYFNNTVDDAILCFPGGFLVDVEEEGPGGFISAGFTALDIQGDGRSAVSFDPDVQVEMLVPPATVNPVTKALIAPGDEIPVYSYDLTSGRWANEATVTVADKAAGPAVSFTTSHFSYWNLDWHQTPYCSSSRINFRGSFNALFVRLLDVETGQFLSYGRTVTASDPILDLANVPANRPIEILAFSNQDDLGNVLCGGSIWNDVAGRKLVSDLCNSPIDVDIDLASARPDSMLSTVTVDVELFCPTSDLALRPNGVLYHHDPFCGDYQYLGTMEAGHLEVGNLRLGQTYSFAFFYDDEEYRFVYQVDSDRYVFREELPELCR